MTASTVRDVEVAPGLALRVVDSGRPGQNRGGGEDGTPIVLVHGIAGTAADWGQVAPDLATHHRVIAYDQRGHGGSGRASDGRTGYTIDQLLADLAALIDALGLPAVHLVGHSMGGLVALRYTLDRPLGARAPTRSLVIMDTAPAPAGKPGAVGRRIVPLLLEGTAAVMTAARSRRERHHAGGPAGDAEPASHTDPPDSTDPTDPTDQAAPAKPANPTEQQLAGFSDLDPEALVGFGRALTDYPSLVGRLTEIRVPTTVIVGEHDAGLRAGAHTLAQAIPGARLAVIAGAGHNPHTSHPLAWLSAVDGHFADQGDDRDAGGADVGAGQADRSPRPPAAPE
jgi:pimeloyl-ACP methyl ester carboxylesterase